MQWELRRNETIENLKDYCGSHPVDLVVMGIQSNLTEYKLFGNTTTEAVQLMQFPLLVVPNDIQFTGIHKVIYASDISYLKEHCEMTYLKNLLDAFDASLDILHVQTDGREDHETFERVINEIFGDREHQFRYVSNPRVDDGIAQGLEENPSDLLVMIPHKRGFIESIFKGSRTNQMTVRTRIPLLVIPMI